MTNKLLFPCSNCSGKVKYGNVYNNLPGWGHIFATGCIKPAVNMKNWKKYLKFKKENKHERD